MTEQDQDRDPWEEYAALSDHELEQWERAAADPLPDGNLRDRLRDIADRTRLA